MNDWRILVLAAATIYAMTAPHRGLAAADNASPGFDSGGAFDRAGATMLNGASPDLPASVDATSTDQPLGTNPLWGIPLSVLKETRDRPLFSPSRRRSAAPAVGRPVRVTKAVSPAAAPKPALDLVGTVEGNSEGYAVFIDTTTHSIVRLKTGEGRDGWILRSVSEREVVLYNNDRTEKLELPSISGLSKK